MISLINQIFKIMYDFKILIKWFDFNRVELNELKKFPNKEDFFNKKNDYLREGVRPNLSKFFIYLFNKYM